MFAPDSLLRSAAKLAPGLCRASRATVAGLAILAASVACRAQSALEPEQAGPDFLIQGEYSGKVETVTPMGAQVIALGGGSFKAVFLPGGLPGQGWNGKDRVEAMGSVTAGKAEFSGGGYTATIGAEGATLTGKTDKGELFTFNKTFRKSPTEGALPPTGAVVLFDGNGVSAWKDGTAEMDARMFFKPVGATSTAGAITKNAYQDFTLHLEFREPFQPALRGASRGNSGVYLQGRYEVQVLDSFGSNLATGADTMAPKQECGAIYDHFGPKLNMSFPPLSWQTYDIRFTAAHFDGAGNRTAAANVTVQFNGETVQDRRDMLNHTLAGEIEGAAAGPLRFQAYDSPVYYRNIWITEGASAVRQREGANRKIRNRQGRLVPAGTEGTWKYADGREVPVERAPTEKPMYSRGAAHAF